MSIIIGVFVFAACATVTLAELPPGVETCPWKNNENEYNKCVLEQLKTITPSLAKGIPSLKLPPLDPLYLPSLTVDRNLDSLRIKANMTELYIYGATNYDVKELKADPRDLTVALRVRLPYIYITGNYDVHGRLLLVPLNGAGTFKGNFTNTDAQVNAQGKEVVDKNGVQRIEIDKLVSKIRVGDGTIRLDAPPSHALAADAASTFFNANPRSVLDIASPIIEDTAATVSRALAARALGVLTKKDLIA